MISTNHSQGEHCHHQVKLNSQSRSNNKETAQQLGEMDYINFHVRHIADDLRRAGVPVPGNIPVPDIPGEQYQKTKFTIARGHKSALYLPHWIRDHRDDPALVVNLFMFSFTTLNGHSCTLISPGLHGPFTCSPLQPALC